MLDSATVEQIFMIMRVPLIAERLLFILVGVAGIVGVVLASTTRADAFEAAGRQPKMAWAAILFVSSAALLLRIPFVAWFGAVAVGIYWFDVRPQLKDIVQGGGAW